MKKFLSLVLALVMAMSLVTVSAGAKDFTDASDIEYDDAVAVMSAVGVVDGYTDGSFNPTATLTRGAAAKIICNMILGPTTAAALSADSAPYSDVPANHVFAGYISYCQQQGIISGYADGTFRPAGTLTGYAFMKMLLGALGYDADIEVYTGPNWSIAVAKRALNIGLDDGNDEFVGTKAVTREEACLYAFNALQADMVEYKDNSTISIGDIVISNKSTATVVNDKNSNKIWKDDDATQFAEKYFSKLDVDEDEHDDFGRPATVWSYDGDEIGTYAKEPVLTYTEDVKYTDVNDDVDDAGYEFNTDKDAKKVLTVYSNGSPKQVFSGEEVAELIKKTDKLGGKGVQVELFANSKDVIDTIVMVYTYAAEITSVVEDDKDTKRKDESALELTVYMDGADSNTDTTIDKDTEGFEAIYADAEEGDIVLVTPKGDKNDDDVEILTVALAETVEGEVTSVSADWVKIDGVKYELAAEYSGAKFNVKDEGTFYLCNGYVIHYVEDEAAEGQYLFVVRGGKDEDKFGKATYYAEAVFTDGTSETIVTKKVDGEEKEVGMGLYAFKYDEKKDTYTLTSVKGADLGKVDITKGKTSIKNAETAKSVATVNSKTVFVNIKLDDDEAFDDATVYTGYKKVSTMEKVQAYAVIDGTAEYVFTIDGEAKNDSDDLIYVAGESRSELISDKDLGDYFTYNAIVGGKIVEIMVDADMEDADELNGLYDSASINDDEVYTNLKAKDVDSVTESAVNFKKAADDVVTLEKTVDGKTVKVAALAYTNDVTVFVIDTDGDIATGSINRNYSNVDVTYVTNDDDEVTCFYIEKLA